MSFLNRRDFLHDSARFGAALGGVGFLASSETQAKADEKKTSANDTLRVCMIGVRGQGSGDIQGFAGKNGCVVTTICDVDSAVIGKAMTYAEKAQGTLPKYEKDLRKVFDDKSIDIVSIATPNHWHALAAIWAMQAGKDVYVQKPVSHNVTEGRRMLETARKHKRICQTGTQSRSNPGMRDAIEYVRSGALGKVKLARGVCFRNRPSIGKTSGEQQPPQTMDYDLWCGPASNQLPRRNGKNGPVHYDWHWVWEYGNGDLGNQGIHEMDKARWGLGKDELPKSVVSVGGRFGYDDDGETANTQICIFDYGDAELIFEVRGLPSDTYKGAKVGNIFHCENGYVVCPNYYSGAAFTLDGKKIKSWEKNEPLAHYANFVKAVRSRNIKDLHADIHDGHLSSALCHFGNISYRISQPQQFSAQSKAFGDDKDAYEALERMQEHLKTNMVPLDDKKYRVGRKLLIDGKTESFVKDAEADKFLTREYRKGFEVPQKV